MDDPTVCPKCGTQRPARSPGGLCPGCMLREGLGGGDLSLSHPGGPGATISLVGDTVLHKLSASIGPVPRVLLRDTTQGDDPSPIAQPSSSEMPAARPDRLQLFGEIARGGMGAVLKGRDSDLGRELAVKVLLERHGQDPDLVRRFVEEAQIAGQLQHPGIVPVYELGAFADARPYFTMKLVKGRTLAEMLAARPAKIEHKPEAPAKDHSNNPSLALQACEIRESDLPRFLAIFEAIAQTMAYAHARGVIHRDLKPSNVMVGSFGEVQVMDWGLAKVLAKGGIADDAAAGKQPPQETVIATARSADDGDLSHPGSIMGTPAYMAPEQARGETSRVDERADVFALGSILCELLTGEPAFTGRSAGEIHRKAALGDTASALARIDASAADSDLIALAKDCLSREPEARPRDAASVSGRIASYLASVQDKLRRAELETVEANARAESEGARAKAEQAKRRLAVGLAASILLAGAIGGGSWTAFRLDRDRQRNESDRLVGDALATAKALQGEAERAGPEAVEAWGRALDSADKAKGLVVARPPRATLAADVATTYDAVAKSATESRERVRQVEADRQLVVDLDGARLQMAAVKDDHYDWDSKLAAYAATFRKAGIDFGRQSAEEIATRLKLKRDVQRIAAALDDWAANQGDKKLRDALAYVATTIDPERGPLREAITRGNLAALLAIARDPTARRMPANSVCLLARVLNSLGNRDDAIALLTVARSGAPADFWINHNLGMLLKEQRKPADRADAVRFLTVAVALKPDSSGVLSNLGNALRTQGKYDEAITAYREAIRLKPDLAGPHCNLGLVFEAQGKYAEAIAAYREAIRLQPDLAEAHGNLGTLLNKQGKPAEAIATVREAIRLKPDFAKAHLGLGLALHAQGKPAEAIASCREAIRLQPDLAEAHGNLGILLYRQGKPAEAIAACREAIRLQPDLALAYNGLGAALRAQGKDDEAIAAYREAIRLKPDDAMASNNLGNVLQAQRKHDEAFAAYREAIRIRPGFAEPHCGLGLALRSQAKFKEALAELRKGHELGAKQVGWRYPSAQWVADCEALVALEVRIPAMLRGDDSPKDNAERLALAQICYETKRFAASARFWGEAMANDPKLGDDRQAGHRYNAACSAAMAGTGQGIDDPKPDDAARIKLRNQAKDWLRAELSAWEKVATAAEPASKPLVAKTLQHWKSDADLAGVRDADALAKLPEAERAAWITLWGEVDALLAKVAK